MTGKVWTLHVKRGEEQARGDRRRTIGTYRILHDGTETGLAGTTVEAKGPSDNKVRGNGRCVEPGTYPLATHEGAHYNTYGYIPDGDGDVGDCDRTPKPGLELLDTGARDDILVHPGHGFLASIGCINLTAPLAGPETDVPFLDSRERVIAAIENLKTFLGDAFPKRNGRAIPNARIVIE